MHGGKGDPDGAPMDGTANVVNRSVVRRDDLIDGASVSETLDDLIGKIFTLAGIGLIIQPR